VGEKGNRISAPKKRWEKMSKPNRKIALVGENGENSL